MPHAVPLPPFELAHRVGSLADAEDPWETFERHGLSARTAIETALGDDWDWTGKRVLDFGAGVGRTLRHFTDKSDVAEFHACDIDRDSVAWLNANVPAVHAFANDEHPPLDRPDGTFDLVYCVSVFTHLLDTWAEWLLELRRVLKPGGLLVASFMGEREAEPIAGSPWDPDRMGMFGFAAGQSWDDGGPMVMHSPWWIEQHWGRAFDFVRIVRSGEADPWFIHGLAVLRQPGGEPPTVEELQRPGDDPREAHALAHNLAYVQREAAWLRGELAAAKRGERGGSEQPSGEIDALRAEAAELRAAIERLQAERQEIVEVLRRRDVQLATIASSRSWQLTRPLRKAGEAVRRARRAG